MIGQTIAHYRITAKLGEGGMGEVYRATDTKLGRDVAIKIIPAAFAQDTDRMARFQREAEVLASLNHPNIAAIYGVEDRALIMELVEGEAPKGPMSFDEAWRLASQIAAALEYAHDKGIVHRDLKPANVKITPEGVVKLLDFGLAKAFTNPREAPANAENSPTLTIGATEVGVILGTAAYMSPEQAKGKSVDKRADIWSFGVVLYELLTGERMFQGEDVSDTLAQVLTKEPDLSGVPFQVQKLLRRCLEKDPKQRLRDIGEARFLLEDGSAETKPARRMPWAIAVGVLAIISVITSWIAWRSTRPVDRPLQPLVRLDVDLGPDAVAGQFTTAVISPDGARLVFSMKGPDGKQLLATRLLAETKPRILSGTESGRDPFFSPDGKWIGFFADGKMKKIPAQGGAPVVLCGALYESGANWAEDGSIIAALNTPGVLSRVSSQGGTPRLLGEPQGDGFAQVWPQPLPGNQAVLVTLAISGTDFELASIAAVSLETGKIKVLMRGAYFGRYVPTGDGLGHLVYVHEGALFGVPFDPVRLELRGTAVPLLDDVASDPNSGGGQFSVSGAPSGPGAFVYRTGRVVPLSYPVVWLDHLGKTQPLLPTPGFYVTPRFSPDGQRLALTQAAGNNRGLYVFDWQRETMSRLTFNTNTQRTAYPVWSPDGKHIVFSFSSENGNSLVWIRADGAGETQHLLDSKNLVFPYALFPDGRRLMYSERDPESDYNLWTVILDVSDPDHPKPGKPELFLRTPYNEGGPAVSPDGHWIAYHSNESGRFEVYVRPFPGPGGKWQISSAGGWRPVWSDNGRELFFENLTNRLMVAAYDVKTESFVHEKPRVWSDQQLGSAAPNYALAPDGRFAIFLEQKAPTEEKNSVHMTFLLNFFDELRRRAPAGGK